MANELRVRTNFLGGLTEDNPLASGATTLNSAALAAAPAITSTQHMAIILDPDGVAGAPEVVYITAHTAAATSATILKGQEGTTARAHDRDTPWIHGPTIKDFDASGGGVGLIGFTAYNPGTQQIVSATSTAMVDVDATNLVVGFTAPPSGKVLVRLTGYGIGAATTGLSWALREGSTDLLPEASLVYGVADQRFSVTIPQTGVAAGAHSYKWAHSRPSGAGTVSTRYGGTSGQAGPAIMEVWAVNL